MMNAVDVSRVLAKIAAFDQRTVGELDVLAWLEAIGDIDPDDALAAVTVHYRQSVEWLRPNHIRVIVNGFVRERHREARERRELAAAEQSALGRGPVSDRSAEVMALVRSIVDSLPIAESDRVHERAKAHARREHGRPERALPKARRKPPRDWPAPQTNEIAAFATRYLVDGHSPADVAARLAVSERWCRSTLARLGVESAA